MSPNNLTHLFFSLGNNRLIFPEHPDSGDQRKFVLKYYLIGNINFKLDESKCLSEY